MSSLCFKLGPYIKPRDWYKDRSAGIELFSKINALIWFFFKNECYVLFSVIEGDVCNRETWPWGVHCGVFFFLYGSYVCINQHSQCASLHHVEYSNQNKSWPQLLASITRISNHFNRIMKYFTDVNATLHFSPTLFNFEQENPCHWPIAGHLDCAYLWRDREPMSKMEGDKVEHIDAVAPPPSEYLLLHKEHGFADNWFNDLKCLLTDHLLAQRA